MESQHQKNTTHKNVKVLCTNPCCFFCAMNEADPSLRRAGIAKCFKEMPLRDDQEHVLALSGLWNIAMTQPDDPEFPLLGIFECAANLIRRGISDKEWLLRDQNIYIPYYAAHIIGSYTMNKVQFAERAVKSGVISSLMELLRGKMSWVEKRVAVRALGHLASHERTFEAIAVHEAEIIHESMETASTCLDEVYVEFVGVEHTRRLKYHCDLLTRGTGGLEIENRKAEEWASQLQCWSLYLLNCFACKERSLNRIYSKEVIESLCNTSRSSDEWQYMAIDCLLLILKDPDTRYKTLLQDYNQLKYGNLDLKSKRAERTLEEIWDLKVERKKRENIMTEEEARERRLLAGVMKQEGNQLFWSGDIEAAVLKYTEALELCPLKMRKERVVLHSNRAQCHLLLRDTESAISDSTRALNLSSVLSPHSKSLWRRSQAYDMKGLAKESLMDCLMFINDRIKSLDTNGVKIPYYAARMITKQMNTTWIFATARSKNLNNHGVENQESNGHHQVDETTMTTDTRKRQKGIAGKLLISCCIKLQYLFIKSCCLLKKK
uniref:ARM repeat N-terminal plant domain-containing protein n=1 Tax=Vitis vinifera TaxID=29760 RepID=F6HSV5_VITVI